MEIRRAQLGDVPAIEELSRILFGEMERLQPEYYREADQDRKFLLSVIAEEKGDILLAQEEGKILGFALVREEETPPFSCMVPRRYAHLIDLVTAPGHRGRGVGGSLVRAVRQWAKERGLEYVELYVLSNNGNALRFYEGEGFREATRIMRLEP